MCKNFLVCNGVCPDGNITSINSTMYTKRQGCSVFNSRKKEYGIKVACRRHKDFYINGLY